MQENQLDNFLVTQFKAGHKEAFNLLMLRYQAKIIKLVSRQVKDQHEVYDITQETFIRAYRALPQFKEESAFYTWIFRIAVNVAKNYYQSQSRRPQSIDIDIEDAQFLEELNSFNDNTSPENYVLGDELNTLIAKVMEELPVEMKQALLLRDIEGKSYEEISLLMACPIGTVRSRISRAREMVDAKIRGAYE
jgi:RNA polymerase sigma-70 factor (ECF subfamily)